MQCRINFHWEQLSLKWITKTLKTSKQYFQQQNYTTANGFKTWSCYIARKFEWHKWSKLRKLAFCNFPFCFFFCSANENIFRSRWKINTCFISPIVLKLNRTEKFEEVCSLYISCVIKYFFCEKSFLYNCYIIMGTFVKNLYILHKKFNHFNSSIKKIWIIFTYNIPWPIFYTSELHSSKSSNNFFPFKYTFENKRY